MVKNSKSLIALLLCVCFATGLSLACSKGDAKHKQTQVKEGVSVTVTSGRVLKESAIPAGAKALMKAYPDFVKGYSDNKLMMSDGSTIVYDDGKKKSFEERLNNTDPEDVFFVEYDRSNWHPDYLHDPGRFRCEVLFKKMYGQSAAAVQKTLVPVKWFGQTVRFTKVNGAADALRKVAAEIAKHPELKQYVKSSGTFYWRKVRNGNRLSPHSFGIAIDVAVSKSDFWGWSTQSEMAKIQYRNKIPRKLVEIFEKHGFAWGGRWYHFDTMHFEYRPELFAK